MYLFRDTPLTRTLVEMTPGKARKALAYRGRQDLWFRRIEASTAHHWVRSGGLHETALYTDIDGRIRRASNDES
jgi:hypothetical protein